ncbi:MAG: hypothetical protein HON90_16015 [Halobacteriovoraceae bacterium]|jgi:hypothetical protein|nr:hypothetical protein [Halobacteriovoraceae bacterium]
MKKIIILFCLLLSGQIVSANDNQQDSYNLLREIKFNILKGNLTFAKRLLRDPSLSAPKIESVKNRYLALIYFIEENYTEVINVLNKPSMKSFSHQSKICYLKIISHIILNQEKELIYNWKDCKAATSIYLKNSDRWIQILVDLKTTKDKNYINKMFDEMAIDSVEEKTLRIYLKLALYLNQQNKIIDRFKYFSSKPLENPELRELIGLNYYRSGNLIKAYQLMENLETTNSEVFKGNLFLFQKKYELAYAQLKLALKKKYNSQNAIDRLIPLAWKLNQWEEGLSFLQRISNQDSELATQTLKAAFLTQNNSYAKANIIIKRIMQKTKSAAPIEVHQINVLNSIKLKQFRKVENSAANSCSANDGINCWLIIAMNSWEGLVENLEKKDPIHDNLDDLISYYTQSRINTPIIEESLLNQRNIEELDNNLIQLVP